MSVSTGSINAIRNIVAMQRNSDLPHTTGQTQELGPGLHKPIPMKLHKNQVHREQVRSILEEFSMSFLWTILALAS